MGKILNEIVTEVQSFLDVQQNSSKYVFYGCIGCVVLGSIIKLFTKKANTEVLDDNDMSMGEKIGDKKNK